MHWKDTQHCYSLELETQRVWDYAGDNYVHRLIQSKTDGKLVELNTHCIHSGDGCGSCNYADSELNEALLNSKVEVVMISKLYFNYFFDVFVSQAIECILFQLCTQIVKEYNDLLATQLENQKLVSVRFRTFYSDRFIDRALRILIHLLRKKYKIKLFLFGCSIMRLCFKNLKKKPKGKFLKLLRRLWPLIVKCRKNRLSWMNVSERRNFLMK